MVWHRWFQMMVFHSGHCHRPSYTKQICAPLKTEQQKKPTRPCLPYSVSHGTWKVPTGTKSNRLSYALWVPFCFIYYRNHEMVQEDHQATAAGPCVQLDATEIKTIQDPMCGLTVGFWNLTPHSLHQFTIHPDSSEGFNQFFFVSVSQQSAAT